MDYLVICVVALLASGLTLFSGFGLGTLLMPVIAVFFSLEVAVAITAVVHLANNLFKLLLLGRKADREVLLRFGLPAVLCAWLGAALLVLLAGLDAGIAFSLFGSAQSTTLLNLVVGGLILLFVTVELLPAFAKLNFERRFLSLGGAMSGFFGGLSGHQGAFRSMFLLKAGLDKQSFVATSVSIAVLVDVSRLLVYGGDLLWREQQLIDWGLVGAACVSAFAGAFIGARLLNKVTLRTVQILVSAMLVLIALALILGLI